MMVVHWGTRLMVRRERWGRWLMVVVQWGTGLSEGRERWGRWLMVLQWGTRLSEGREHRGRPRVVRTVCTGGRRRALLGQGRVWGWCCGVYQYYTQQEKYLCLCLCLCRQGGLVGALPCGGVMRVAS